MNDDNVYELGESGEAKPDWQLDFEAALAKYTNKPMRPNTGEKIAAAVAGPLRRGLAANALISRVWDVLQTESDRESGNIRVFPRQHTRALIEAVDGVRVLASLRLEGATEEECAPL